MENFGPEGAKWKFSKLGEGGGQWYESVEAL